jgi:hypothetical protein
MPGQGCSIYPNDEILDSLGSSVGNTLLNCGFFDFKTCTYRSDSLLRFDYDGLAVGKGTYLKGVGYISSCSGEPPPCSGYTDMLGAVINGVLWGDTTLTTIKQTNSTTPGSLHLYQNYPNPFNPTTRIKFDIPNSGNVSIKIYDITGKEIIELVNQYLSPGTYEALWDADGFASGVYYYRLETDGFSKTNKMLLVR